MVAKKKKAAKRSAGPKRAQLQTSELVAALENAWREIQGEHTDTSNIRRNPGGLLIGQGIDPCMEINRSCHIRICKTRGHFQFHVDGVFASGFFDRDQSQYPIPDYGKFGLRLIGSDVMADISKFRVHAIEPQEKIWEPWP